MILFFLAAYGLTFLLCEASILDAPRELVCRIGFVEDLLDCYFCTGIWTSAAVSLLLWPGVSLSLHIAHALAGATTTYAIDQALIMMEHLGGEDG